MRKKTHLDRNGLIRLIHVAQRQLGLDDETYRAVLKEATGHTSCSLMSVPELETALERLKKGGFKVKKKKPPANRQYSPESKTKIIKDQVDKLRAVWIDMHKTGIIDNGSEAALDQFVEKQTKIKNGGIGVKRAAWINNSKLAGLCIESLKQWRTRVRSQWANEDFKLISYCQNLHDEHQDVVVKRLLDERRIMYWPVFEELNIEKSDRFCTNRKELNRE